MEYMNKLFKSQVSVINVGLPSFAAELKQQGVPVVDLDWRPPAGGNPKLIALLDKVRRHQSKLGYQA